jgi:hypothetical protein
MILSKTTPFILLLCLMVGGCQRGRALILDIWSSEKLQRSERCGGESFVSKRNSILDEYTILTVQMV